MTARARGYAMGRAVVRVPDSPGTAVAARIELHRGAPVSGIVVDEGGAPIAGARVHVRERAVAQTLFSEENNR